MLPAPTNPTPVTADELLDDLDAIAKREADLQVFSTLHNATILALLGKGISGGFSWRAAYQVEREYIADEWLQSLLYNRLLERLETLSMAKNPRLYAKVRNALSFVQYAGRRQQYVQNRQSIARFTSRGASL